MNQKGFAITGIVYGILVLFILTLIGLLSLFNSRRAVLDELKNKVIGEVTERVDLSPVTYSPNNLEKKYHEFVAQARGYYQIELYSAQMGTNLGTYVSTEIYLKKGETLYFLVGSNNYNNGDTEIRKEADNSSTVLVRSSIENSYIEPRLEDRDFINTKIEKNSYKQTGGKAKISYLSREKENSNLNKVRYIKDCIDGNSIDNNNHWVEIKAIVDGVNQAYQKTVTGTVPSLEGYDYYKITDGIIDSNSYSSTSSNGKQCVTVDLEIPYNIDFIIIWHNYNDNRIYYNREVSTSLDGENYNPIDVLEKKETSLGIEISSYDEPSVMLVGDIYVPIKNFDDAKWVRVFHHNNKNGSVLWASNAQVLLKNGYQAKHRQSILYNLENFRNNQKQFEFLLEYSELIGYNRWIQSSNPTTTSESISGYTPIHIDFSSNGWSGLAKSNSGSTLIDGNVGNGNWNYAIGAIKAWNGGIPGASSTSIKESTDLWIRIPS